MWGGRGGSRITCGEGGRRGRDNMGGNGKITGKEMGEGRGEGDK